MFFWHAGIFLCLMALVLFIFMLMERQRIERLTRNLGGKWTWSYVLGMDKVPYLLIKLWPDLNDAHTEQIMAAALQFQVAVVGEGQALSLGEQVAGHLKIPFYQVCLINARQPVAARKVRPSTRTAG